MTTRQISPGVHEAVDQYPAVAKADVKLLLADLPQTPKGRSRICCHKSNDDRLHEMFMAFTDASYFRPSKHVGKDESLHVLEGAGDYVFYNAGGDLTDIVALGAYGSSHQFYCRIPESVNHSLEVYSNEMLIHETTTGPFFPEQTVFAPWASVTVTKSLKITSVPTGAMFRRGIY